MNEKIKIVCEDCERHGYKPVWYALHDTIIRVLAGTFNMVEVIESTKPSEVATRGGSTIMTHHNTVWDVDMEHFNIKIHHSHFKVFRVEGEKETLIGNLKASTSSQMFTFNE